MDATQAFPLRALSIGEIFDRAVTVYVRNAVTLTAIVLAFLAPLSAAEYFLLPHDADMSKVMGPVLHPRPGAPAPLMPFPSWMLGVFALIVLFGFLFLPFASNAVAVGVAAAYNGRRPRFDASYTTVFRRALPLIGTGLLEIGVFMLAYIASVMLLMIPLTVGILLVRTALPLAVVFFVAGVVIFLAMILMFVTLFIAYSFATYAATLEGMGPASAISSSFRRILTRTELTKALLMGLAYIGLEIGIYFVTVSVATVVVLLVRVDFIEYVVSAVLNSAFTAFLTVLLAVYYYDVRTRAEGLDLELALDRLATPA
jgi:hypothetical protein